MEAPLGSLPHFLSAKGHVLAAISSGFVQFMANGSALLYHVAATFIRELHALYLCVVRPTYDKPRLVAFEKQNINSALFHLWVWLPSQGFTSVLHWLGKLAFHRWAAREDLFGGKIINVCLVQREKKRFSRFVYLLLTLAFMLCPLFCFVWKENMPRMADKLF